MAIPTYGVVLMSVGIPLFLLICCCCCCAACAEEDDDLEANRQPEPVPIRSLQVSRLVQESKKVPEANTNQSLQFSRAPLAQEVKKASKPNTDPSAQVISRAPLAQESKQVTQPNTNPGLQVSRSRLVQESKKVPEPNTNPNSQVSRAPLVQENKKVPKPPKNSPDREDKPAPKLSTTTSDGYKLSGHSQRFESIKLKSYEYEELVAATGGFSNFNLLGEGGFGPVYKGTFPNGDVLAIKKLKYEAGRKEDEFEAEILTISRAHHVHLVKLVGYCSDEANRLIVYEYVPNNSLKYHLHGKDKAVISWANRIKIAIGSAKGIEYLHQGCDPMIIHRDIKADNILLDKNFKPKIADFGLARDISYSVSHISTDPKGTFGYLAPEYANDRKLTDKSDVFSFGVVVLELITGKKHVFFEDNDNIAHNLAVWMVFRIKKTLESGRYRELIDPKLEKEYIDENELGRMLHCAAACVYKPAIDRPNMRQIVEALQGNIPLEQIWTISDRKFLYDGAPYSSLPQGSPEI